MLKFVILIVSAGLATMCAAMLPTKNHVTARADASLASFLLKSPRATSSSASMQCFNLYLPLLQASSDQWAEEYQKCLDTAEDARNITLDRASQELKNLSTDAAGVCNYIQSCDAINDALTSIDCFSALTTNTLSTIYTVSNNASDAASIIHQEIINIEIDLNRCTNASERAYLERSARIYDALDECLNYGPPPTVAPPTTTPVVITTEASREFEENLMLDKKRARSSDANDLTSLLNAWLEQNRGATYKGKLNSRT
ncbi:protein TsetseEP-like [Eurosta solidaginis]|uniref:protein TsetseEP-like n=1 Tax=Eurosta solidaginis TaxID=178769 RepID=UPI003530EB2C